MSLDELVPDEQAEHLTEMSDDTTIQDLINIYGKEAVRRGLSYMASLEQADQEFRESASESDEYGKRFTEAQTDGEVEVDEKTVDKVNEDWQDAMEGDGLGLED